LRFDPFSATSVPSDLVTSFLELFFARIVADRPCSGDSPGSVQVVYFKLI
jgi:hypothetical protein